MNVFPRQTATPAKAFMLLCSLVVVLAVTPARASVIQIPADTTGYVERFNYAQFTKFYGRLAYGVWWYHLTQWLYRSFLKFSLTTLPDSCVLISAELDYFQSEHTGWYPWVSIRAIADPVPLSAESLYWSMDGAELLAPTERSPDGWVRWQFDSSGLSALDSSRQAGALSVGVHFELGGETYMARADGYNGAEPPYLRITYVGTYWADIQALHAELLTYPLVAERSDTALLVLMNNGPCTSGPFWAYVSSPELALESTLVEPIEIGKTVSVRVSLPSPQTSDTMTNYCLWANEDRDTLPGNDTARLLCWAFPAGTYSAEGFENSSFPPPGWVTVNNDGGSQHWLRADDTLAAHSGRCLARAPREETRRNDDWLISRSLTTAPGWADTVGFFYRTQSPVLSESAEVWVMSGQTVADTVTCLWGFGGRRTSYSQIRLGLDEFDGRRVFIAFRSRTIGEGLGGVDVDDVYSLRRQIPGTQEPTDFMARAPTLRLEPNPASGRFVAARYALGNRPNGRLTLRDVLGRTVKSFALDPSGSTRLDLRGFPPGVYVSTLEPSSPLVCRKLILTAPR